MLGTPAVRTNSIVGEADERIFRLLETEYGLLFSFADGGTAVERAKELVDRETTAAEWQRRRARLLEDAPDVTGEIVSIIHEAALGRESSGSG